MLVAEVLVGRLVETGVQGAKEGGQGLHTHVVAELHVHLTEELWS